MEYRCLKQQIYRKSTYALVPIRNEDKFEIMKWRNEQIYHLRQQKLLSIKDQEEYFHTVVASLFEQENPRQILFSYLENNICIGYGGLVHINWQDRNAEISFIINTALEKEFFELHWTTYLFLIEQVAFQDLNLHKIFTYALDIRPHLYKTIETAGYQEEARLKQHWRVEDKYIDVVINSKINS